MADAADVPNLGNVTVGANASADVLYRLLGRVAHSATGSRGLFRQQLFAATQPTATPFHAIAHGLDVDLKQGFAWVPGQALLSAKAYADDAKIVAGKGKQFQSRTIPGAAHSGTIAVESSKSILPDKEGKVIAAEVPKSSLNGTPAVIVPKAAGGKDAPVLFKDEPTQAEVTELVRDRMGMKMSAWVRQYGSVTADAIKAFKEKVDAWPGIKAKVLDLNTKFGSKTEAKEE
jgi:hypothetical protein